MGLVGPGFVGAHHIDAVRRLGFVDVVAIAASTEGVGAKKAERLRHPEARTAATRRSSPIPTCTSSTTPRPTTCTCPVILAALARGKHVISDKPLAMTGDGRAPAAGRGERRRRRARRDVQLPRQPAGAAGARDDRRRRARRRALHPRRLPAGLAAGADRLLVAPRAGQGRRELRGRRHRIALVRSGPARRRAAHRRGPRRPDDGDRDPAQAGGVDRSVRRRAATSRREAVAITQRRPRHDPRAVRRRREGLRVGRAGLRRATRTISGSRCNGRRASLRWLQERQNELWIGRRETANAHAAEGPVAAVAGRARLRAPAGGHQEGWADAFCNVMRDIYGFIAAGKRPADPRPPAFATFEDGYRAAVRRRRHPREPRRGGAWTKCWTNGRTRV